MNTVGELLLIKANLQRSGGGGAAGGRRARRPRCGARSCSGRRGSWSASWTSCRTGCSRCGWSRWARCSTSSRGWCAGSRARPGKEIDFDPRGGDVELDKLIVEELSRSADAPHPQRDRPRRRAARTRGRSRASRGARRCRARGRARRATTSSSRCATTARASTSAASGRSAVERGSDHRAAGGGDSTERELLNLLFLPGLLHRAPRSPSSPAAAWGWTW